jgi:hypothetical protein
MSDSKLTDFPRRNRCVHHCRQLPTHKRVSKNLQKFLQKIWQGFEKFLAKTSKKDDKQNRLTPLEVRRTFQNSARSHPESARKRLNNPEDQGLVTG